MKVARSVAIGTCDADARPHGMRAAALRIGEDRLHATVFLAHSIAGPTLRNLAVNPRVAVQVSDPSNYRTLQLKGRMARLADASPDDHEYVLRFIDELATVVDQIGMPYHRVVRMNCWPSHAIDFLVDEIYLQTPGPGAGKPLAGRSP